MVAARAVVLVLLGFADRADADEAPDVPFGLLDRMRIAPFHMSATDEVSGADHGRTSSLALHVQASTDWENCFSFYGTLPLSILLDDTQLAAAGGPLQREPRTVLGTADVGVFGGGRRDNVTTLFRFGALLPTGARAPHPWLPSARAGDRVLEMPQAAGIRMSVSRQYSGRTAYRIDAGIDVASVLSQPGNPVHAIPRAGAGMLVMHSKTVSYSLGTAVSMDPFVDTQANLRWSAGVTGRYARHGHVSFVQPAVTVAMTHTAAGWAASLLVDLLATTAALGDDYE